jgi:hypothetical protein
MLLQRAPGEHESAATTEPVPVPDMLDQSPSEKKPLSEIDMASAPIEKYILNERV